MSTPTLQIRNYTRTDFDDCIALFESNLDKFFDPSELELYQTFLATRALEGSYSVVQKDGRTVAAGGYFHHKGAYWMDWGMVHRQNHRQGIGTELLNHRIAQLYKIDVSAILKLATSQHTVSFYEKHGFEIQDFVKNGYGEGLHKYLLQMSDTLRRQRQ